MKEQWNDPIKLLRQLKGAPLAVLLAFSWTRSRLSADYLVTVTGYTDKPVSQALKVLLAYGWIVKVQGGWQIAAGVQLPLISEESEKFRSSSSSTINPGGTTIEQEQEVRKNSDSFHSNYRTMKLHGIREPALSRLSGLEHVTPGFILAHIKQVRQEHGQMGTVIHRVENNWPVSEVVEVIETPIRYTDGIWNNYLVRAEESEEE